MLQKDEDEIEITSSDKRSSRPEGCYSTENKKDGVKYHFNPMAATNICAGKILTDVNKGNTENNKETVYTQICAMDRSLPKSAAAYYSPYKLKASMRTGSRQEM